MNKYCLFRHQAVRRMVVVINSVASFASVIGTSDRSPLTVERASSWTQNDLTQRIAGLRPTEMKAVRGGHGGARSDR
jgi:hypothetical protein